MAVFPISMKSMLLIVLHHEFYLDAHFTDLDIMHRELELSKSFSTSHAKSKLAWNVHGWLES